MASLDVVFRFRPADRAVVESCFGAARRRARRLGVRSFRSTIKEAEAGFSIHANTYVVDIFQERLRRDWPTIAEATPCRRTPASRRHLALGLVEIMTRWRLGMYERYDEAWIPTLRARREPAYSLPHLLWVDDELIQTRMLTTSEIMASWHFDEVAPEVLLEELHTAAELMLASAVNRRAKKLSFAELVAVARGQGLFSPYAGQPDLVASHRATEQGQKAEAATAALLLTMKDVRKQARHAGRAGAKAWLDEHFWEVAATLERLAGRVPPRAATE